MSECNALAAYTALSHYSYTSITGSFESNSKISIGYFIIVKIKKQEIFYNYPKKIPKIPKNQM
jgi:hypothetical protein